MTNLLFEAIGEIITLRCIRQPKLVYKGILSSKTRKSLRDNILILERVTSTYHENPLDYLIISLSEVSIEIDHGHRVTNSDLGIGSGNKRERPGPQHQLRPMTKKRIEVLDST